MKRIHNIHESYEHYIRRKKRQHSLDLFSYSLLIIGGGIFFIIALKLYLEGFIIFFLGIASLFIFRKKEKKKKHK